MKNKRTLSDFRALHSGETILVCGCGVSLSELPQNYAGITIGVNDVGRYLDPTYLVVLNPKNQFKDDRFDYIEHSRARAIFSQLDLRMKRSGMVRFKLGERGGTDTSRSDALPYTRNSTYVALCLAMFMGAKRIGLIGVDFTEHHFFANTGKHVLAGEIDRINAEYMRLSRAADENGIQIFNLSESSRVTAFPKIGLAEFHSMSENGNVMSPRKQPSIFIVDYQFKSCGNIFSTGLSQAAKDLELTHTSANWDDPKLAAKIAHFNPKLLFVVHGRQFVRKWGRRIQSKKTALWLLDEPYEVDDSSVYSRYFDTVFLNDYSTADRHRNAYYLPAAFDPHLHRDTGDTRDMEIGFVGGASQGREQMLLALLEAGHLSYVVGGPWKAKALNKICIAGNLPPDEVAQLYRRTKVIVNIFREKHHYNREGTPAATLNPRIYEALACGAAVVSESRPELQSVFPEVCAVSSPEELIIKTNMLLEDKAERHSLIKKSKRRLAGHSYTDRLKKVLEVCLNEKYANSPLPVESKRMTYHKTDQKYAILMVVCDACDIVKLSTLRTLRYSQGDMTRLYVVDSGSKDGVQCWLKMLARRGDIELISSVGNIGHGEGLELARKMSRSEYLVSLDSDAFPLREGWLEEMRSRLNDRVLVTGILHHRDYVHPSCLMISRRTMDRMQLSFLDEKQQKSGLDVGERISVSIKENGYRISGIRRTGYQCRGSRSEPVCLGSEYEGLVYHQWYMTRSAISGGAPVDDVPNEDLKRSLEGLLSSGECEFRDVAVVIGARYDADAPERLRNLRAVIERMNLQSMHRWRYRLVLIEQDSEPRLKDVLQPVVDIYKFAYNPGPYNRSWGFNVGAKLIGDSAKVLCFLDADLLVPTDFLIKGLLCIENGAVALQPYKKIVYLEESSTQEILEQCSNGGVEAFDEKQKGKRFTDSHGGCLWVKPGLYQEMCGHDERFEGWGFEDREFFFRLSKYTKVEKMDGCLLHLFHEPTGEQSPAVVSNEKIFQQIRTRQIGPWSNNEYGNANRYQSITINSIRRREWEHWDEWSERRIEEILLRKYSYNSNPRRRLVDLAVTLGNKVLDVGCGPGALWSYVNAHYAFSEWCGVDVTRRMLKIAKRHFPDTPILQADAAELPFEDGAYDVVVIRHVLEHLPANVLAKVLTEAVRVSNKKVVLAFYKPPHKKSGSVSHRVGEGFIETHWSETELKNHIGNAGGSLVHRITSHKHRSEVEEIWFIEPNSRREAYALSGEPCVSVIMPFYRRHHTLKRAVKSLQSQNYENWELIIIDNEGAARLVFDDPRIRVVVHNEHASASYARNKGLSYAKGELVCFFDDDDEMYPDYLSTFVGGFLTNPKAKLVRVGMRRPNGRVDYSYATPECCLRLVDASPTWTDENTVQDQQYFERIISARGWSAERGEVVTVKRVLCQAHSDPSGGLRAGAL